MFASAWKSLKTSIFGSTATLDKVNEPSSSSTDLVHSNALIHSDLDEGYEEIQSNRQKGHFEKSHTVQPIIASSLPAVNSTLAKRKHYVKEDEKDDHASETEEIVITKLTRSDKAVSSRNESHGDVYKTRSGRQVKPKQFSIEETNTLPKWMENSSKKRRKTTRITTDKDKKVNNNTEVSTKSSSVSNKIDSNSNSSTIIESLSSPIITVSTQKPEGRSYCPYIGCNFSSGEYSITRMLRHVREAHKSGSNGPGSGLRRGQYKYVSSSTGDTIKFDESSRSTLEAGVKILLVKLNKGHTLHRRSSPQVKPNGEHNENKKVLKEDNIWYCPYMECPKRTYQGLNEVFSHIKDHHDKKFNIPTNINCKFVFKHPQSGEAMDFCDESSQNVILDGTHVILGVSQELEDITIGNKKKVSWIRDS